MAHFAKLNSNSEVIAVHVVNNDVATDETTGINFLKNLYVAPVTYPTIKKYTDENGNEYKYLIDWDEDNLRWIATDNAIGDNNYYWDSSNLIWISI